MKSLLLFLLLPLQIFAQELPGLWVGILHNDSTDADLHYEIVISESKGKLSGYSYTTFIVEGKKFTGVKKLSLSQRFGKLYAEDDGLVYHNYDFEPPKGVKQLSILEMSTEGDMISGKFTTSRTKQYGRPVTGHIHLLRKNDIASSGIIEILKQLNLASSLSFIPPADVAVVPSPSTKDTRTATTIQPTTPETTIHTPPTEIAAAPKPKPDIQQQLSTRIVETIQTINFSSDSLLLELYDNGYVDGDSVSIILNGKAFLTNIRLSEKAEKKMIYITPEMGDSINLVMFAENLGSIAPNSGLAIIRDGKTQHRITFTGDLNRNAAIILRRKKQLGQ